MIGKPSKYRLWPTLLVTAAVVDLQLEAGPPGTSDENPTF